MQHELASLSQLHQKINLFIRLACNAKSSRLFVDFIHMVMRDGRIATLVSQGLVETLLHSIQVLPIRLLQPLP